MATQPIYQFYCELWDYNPKIWRRFQAPANTTIAKLCYILMTLYEMQGNHMFAATVPVEENLKVFLKSSGTDSSNVKAFGPRERRFEVPHEDIFSFAGYGDGEGDKPEDATAFKIKELLPHPGDQMLFEYDFGDSWEVAVRLEEIVIDKALPAKELPRVLAGEGYGIVEDCGGVGGLYDLSEALQEGEGDAYDELVEWLGCDTLDLGDFDLEQKNRDLKRGPRFFKGIYEG